MSKRPDRDHPWYGLRGRGPGGYRHGFRTICDELLELEISKVDRFNKPRIESYESDGSVRGARDPSYSPLPEGGMRKPVRYD